MRVSPEKSLASALQLCRGSAGLPTFALLLVSISPPASCQVLHVRLFGAPSSRLAPHWQCTASREVCTARPRSACLGPGTLSRPLPCACAVRGLLLDSRRKSQPSNYAPAVAEGLLAVRSGGGDAAGRHSAGMAAAAGQQAEVAMLCLERLISLGGCKGEGGSAARLGRVVAHLTPHSPAHARTHARTPTPLPFKALQAVPLRGGGVSWPPGVCQLAALASARRSAPCLDTQNTYARTHTRCRSVIQQPGALGGAACAHWLSAGEAVQAGAGE